MSSVSRRTFLFVPRAGRVASRRLAGPHWRHQHHAHPYPYPRPHLRLRVCLTWPFASPAGSRIRSQQSCCWATAGCSKSTPQRNRVFPPTQTAGGRACIATTAPASTFSTTSTPSATATCSSSRHVCRIPPRPVVLSDASPPPQNPRAHLTFTDGRCQVAAQLTAHCLRELHARCPHIDFTHTLAPGSVVAVRRYTIRYTSYGPPRDQLRLILHAVDWVGDNHAITRARLTPISLAVPLRAVLQQLHDTRAREDSRCLWAQLKAEAGDEQETEQEELPRAMEHSDGASASQVTSHTQLAYGTQVSHTIRPRVVDDEPQFLGINRMEPVLAGNTQRKELRKKPVSSGDEKYNHLLNLLKIPGHQHLVPATSTSANEPVHTPNNNQRPGSAHSAADVPAQPPVTAHVPLETVLEKKRQVEASPEPSRGSKRMRDSESVPPQITNSKLKYLQTDSNQITQLDQMASACSWMAGLKFTHATITVPEDQQSILRKPESWRRPLPGHRFPDHNIPCKIWQSLWEFADEAAAEQVDTDSESDIDPSPDSILESIDPAPDSIFQVDQEQELPTSQVSWSASPSLEPLPEPPARSLHALPPDSSFEAAMVVENDRTVPHTNATSQESQNSTVTEPSNEKEPNMPPSSPPVARTSQDHDEGMELEMEISVPQGLGEDVVEKSYTRRVESHVSGSRSPQSRPIVLVKETPYVNRSDKKTLEHTKPASTHKADANSTWKDPPSTPIILGTYNEPGRVDCEEPRDSSKSSVVSTRNKQAIQEELRVESEQQTREIIVNQTKHETAQSASSLSSTTDVGALRSVPGQQDNTHQAQTIWTEAACPDRIVLPPESTLVSAQIPRKGLHLSDEQTVTSLKKDPDLSLLIKAASPTCSVPAPGSTKRKLDYSPSRKSSCHSKRRKIKIVGFGEDDPSSIDIAAALRREREELLSRFRMERKSSASVPDRPGSAHKIHMLQEDVDMVSDSLNRPTSTLMTPAMSPRHLSLYEDPSPIERPSTNTVLAESALRSFDGKDYVEGRIAISNREHDRDTSNQLAKPSSRGSDPSVIKTPGKETVPNKQIHSLPEENVGPCPITGNPTSINHGPMTVFQRFKEVYPEYIGDTEHFSKQCTQMYTLDLQDRMVPKWQWDDFIIRSLTDFKDYAIERLTRGQDVGEYIQFYKDNVRNTKFQKGIVVNRGTLVRVLEENDLHPPASVETTEQPPTRIKTANLPNPSTPSFRNPKPSRASLPDTFNQHRTPTQDRVNRTKHNHPRHSLPVASHKNHQPRPATNPYSSTARTHIHGFSTTRSTPRSNLLSRLTTDATPSTRTPRSRDLTPAVEDAYREYVIGWQRMKSLTGSSAVGFFPILYWRATNMMLLEVKLISILYRSMLRRLGRRTLV